MQPNQLPKSISKWSKAISEVSDERADDDGYWVYFIPGVWSPEDETHCIHEDDLRTVAAKLKSIKRCSCCSGDWDAFWKYRIKQVGATFAMEHKHTVEALLS